MAVFKCKMCGGDLEIAEGASVAECQYCGSKQTLPRFDSERKLNLYDRANHFRRNNEFDKAEGIYENILNEDPTDAEAYWSLVLCRYGIEYVEDPATHRRVPTVNRAQYTSVFADENYKKAVEYADALQKSVYEDEAKAIDAIQKGILEISEKEDPFDVFICYKETDAQGRRTQDSVLANELYHELTNEGFKVFFSRITLEDKLGTAYEPYIFAALHSARVMVVLGTKPEYFNAVWVKNEWSRYLALIRGGEKKTLIPAYRDMDPYDLPEEFSHLQAQDMSKLGFMQDLIRGVKKIAGATEPKPVQETVVVSSGGANATPLLRRAFMFLEDGERAKADDFCEQVLNLNPENAQAYLGKLMAELCVRRQDDLPDCDQPFDRSNNYQKAVRFGDENLASTLKGYITHINDRNEKARLAGIYDDAVKVMNAARTEAKYKAAASSFQTIPGYKDADVLLVQCSERAEACRKDAIYEKGWFQMTGEAVSSYESAIKTFQTISGWKDADEKIDACRRKIEEIKLREGKAAKQRKKAIAIRVSIVIVCVAIVILLTTMIIPRGKYNKAKRLIDSGDYEGAFLLLNGLNYKDSADQLEIIKPQYQRIVLSKAKAGDYIVFGSYEQDNKTSNGKEDIEWIVLAKEENKALIISRYALDCQQYHSLKSSTTWETCSLRKWLNGTFINSAFSSDEQAMIQRTTITADKNPSYSTSPGNDTNDRVFLLSIAEANNYFSSYISMRCQGTAYCYAQGASKGFQEYCYWWLRSPGYYDYSAAYISSHGTVSDDGIEVNDDSCAVRPALWIDFES